MKNKKMVLLIAAVIVVVAVLAFVAVHAVKLEAADVKTSEVVTVKDELAQTSDQAVALDEEMGEEETFEIVELFGTITEITEDYVMLDAGEMGMIQANTSIDTLIEGVEELAVGQTVQILYDGKMTRSLPAKITAMKIGVYAVQGTVQAIEDGSMTIVQAEGGEVVLTLPKSVPEIAVGDAVTAYTTGVSTMSLPPQMNAIAIVK